MRRWEHKVKIRHLFVGKEDPTEEELTHSMNAIGKALEESNVFKEFDWLDYFQNQFSSLDEANDLLSSMYDFADANSIWIEL